MLPGVLPRLTEPNPAGERSCWWDLSRADNGDLEGVHPHGGCNQIAPFVWCIDFQVLIRQHAIRGVISDLVPLITNFAVHRFKLTEHAETAQIQSILTCRLTTMSGKPDTKRTI